MSRLRARLSYANVMATIAVFIALGGTSYAISKLPQNSVGAKQLKKNSVTTAKIKKEAVTAAKIKKGTLTGSQIDASTLGTVPTANTANSANTATTASIANSIVPSEPWHVIGAPGEPQFQNGCKYEPSEVPPARFYKDHENVVHLEGLYQVAIPWETPLSSFPPAFAPGDLCSFRFLEVAKGRLLQSSLEASANRGAWGVAKSSAS